MIELEIRGQHFALSEERALFWAEASTLVIADFHLGKAESFQQHGLFLPSQANYDDLERLERLRESFDARNVLFLGDLVHTAAGISPELQTAFARWSMNGDFAVRVIIGNHDLKLVQNWPRAWQHVELMDEWVEDDFLFTHEPRPSEHFVWSGHLHPVVSLAFGPDRMRLPCFVITKTDGLVPAFSSLAGGMNVQKTNNHRIFAIGDGTVFELQR